MNNRSSDHQSAVVMAMAMAIAMAIAAVVVGSCCQKETPTNASNGRQQRKWVEMHGRCTPLPEGWRLWPNDAVTKQ